MHPEVVSEEAGHCPECGMKLLPTALVASAGAGHDQGEHKPHAHDHAAAKASSGKTTWSR
jgi:hypothetical protein